MLNKSWKFCLVLMAGLLAVGLVAGAEHGADGAGGGGKKRVVVISVDGLRPDVLLRGEAVNVRGMMKGGCFTFWAETTDVAITLPSHISMLTGLTPAHHKFEWNGEEAVHAEHVGCATLFEVAKKAGYSTAMAAGKKKFEVLNKPGTIDWCFVATDAVDNDPRVVDEAVKMIGEKRPEVMFIHLPDVDAVGHTKGWGTAEQVEAVGKMDVQVGRVLIALREAKVLDETLVILTADHGGAGWTHGADDARSRFIPWVVCGPGVQRGVDLTIYKELRVRTEDTFATACGFLGVKVEGVDGKAVGEIFDAAVPRGPGLGINGRVKGK